MFYFLLDTSTRAESFVLLQKPALLFLFLLSSYPSEELYTVKSILLVLGIFFFCSCLCLHPFATENPSGFPSEQSAAPPWCIGCSSVHGWPSKGHFEFLRRIILQAVMFLHSKRSYKLLGFWPGTFLGFLACSFTCLPGFAAFSGL